MNINVVLLAAGRSARLGQVKQLLYYTEKTLIEIAIEKALTITTKTNVFVVLGAFYEEIFNVVEKYNINVLKNFNWEQGLSTSVKLAVQSSISADGILFMLVDQPFVTVDFLNEMLTNFDPNRILCSKFKNGSGVPMLIPNFFFESLLTNLHGDKGAGFLINKFPDSIMYLTCQAAEFDIDTEEDLKMFNSNQIDL